MEKIANPVRYDAKVLYNEELREALRGIHEVYGNDLGAFFRDASDKKHERHTEANQTKRNSTAAKRKAR
jgi:hypothetical protein